MKQVWKYLTGITVGLIVLTSIFVPVYLYVWKTDPRQHDPIIIWNDSDFSSYNLPGEGTAENPYRIENYNITTSDLYSIYIFSTTKYFVIENCYLESSNENGYAIYIEAVANGTAKIFNNTLHSSYHGIGMFYSDSSQIIDNLITCCVIPLYLEGCEETTILRNAISNPESENKRDPMEYAWGRSILWLCDGTNFSQNTVLWTNEDLNIGVHFSEESTFAGNDLQNVELSLSYSNNVTVENNYGIDSEIRLYDSSNITINSNDIDAISVNESPYTIVRNNQVSQFSIGFYLIADYHTCIIENNWINDKKMSYFIGLNNTSFSTSLSEYGQMYFVECNNITLSNPILFDEILHISFIYCENISVHDLNIQLYLDFRYSDFIVIENNNIRGFQFESSNNVIIENNRILDPYADILGGTNYTIANNDISNIKYGLHQYSFINGVRNLLMYDNRIFDCDYSLTMYDLHNSVIINNSFENVTRGLWLVWFNNVTINNNTFTNSLQGGIHLSGNNAIEYLSLTLENNYVDGKIIGYYVNLDNATVDTGNFAQLFFINCTALIVEDLIFSGLSVLYCNQTTINNVTSSNSIRGIEVSDCSEVYLTNNTCRNSSIGIDVSYTTSVYFANNTCLDNNVGTEFYRSTNCTIEWNSLINNTESGIFLLHSVNCSITYNLLKDNYYWGIEMFSFDGFNLIYNNAFINNNWQETEEQYTSQAFDVENSSKWYNEITLMGNYWDDWAGFGIYFIDNYSGGGSRNSDPYPLSSSPL